MRKDVYEIITERILNQLEKSVVPWHKPWAGGNAGKPKNLISNKEYRGINVFMLAFQGYDSPFWLSFNQVKKCGGNVTKGQKATPVVFWKWIETEKDDPDTGEKKVSSIPLIRYYNVFNTIQCEGIDHKRVKELQEDDTAFDFEPIELCESIVAHMPKRPGITHIENRAYYRPPTDTVNMPKQAKFELPEAYYSTLFHELTHSTGHETRLNRKPSDVPIFCGDKEYSQEELVAEMGAAFLCGVTGIENHTIDNSAAYIDHWLTVLKDKKNKKMLVMAGAQAQKAADYIQGITFDG